MKTGKTGKPERRKRKSNEIVSINPTTGKALGWIACDGRRAVQQAIMQASESFHGWSRLPVKDRQRYLKRLAHVILNQRREIAELIAREQGKPMTEAMGAEILPVLSVLKDLYRNAHKLLKGRRSPHGQILLAHKKSAYRYMPYGVVAVISPWNFPFSVPIPQIAAALVAGNTVVFKPARSAALTGRKIHNLFAKAGLPEGVLNTLVLKEKDVHVMLQHPAVKKIVFTGSTDVGRRVLSAAAEQIKPVILELGGKDAAVVAADAPVERAARGIVWGAMFGSGQACASVERVYVERPVADAFIEACTKEASRLRVGDPLDENTDIGPLSNRQQLKTVVAHVEDAVNKGAKLLIGGKRRGKTGFFFEPTILSQADHSMAVMVEETFGPVLPIMVVDSMDQAIQMANNNVYGLSAYGWTRDRKLAERLMTELEAGTVLINDSACTWGEPNAPWGGIKLSGIGRTRGAFGLREMVQLKYVSSDLDCRKDNAWWFPYDRETRRLFDHAADLLFRQDLRKKAPPLLALLGNRRFVKAVRWPSILSRFHKIL